MENFTLGQSLLLNFTEEDFYPEDLGMSGIVLPGPGEQFRHLLNDTFSYLGTILERPDFIVICRESTLNFGISKRHWMIHRSHVKAKYKS